MLRTALIQNCNKLSIKSAPFNVNPLINTGNKHQNIKQRWLNTSSCPAQQVAAEYPAAQADSGKKAEEASRVDRAAYQAAKPFKEVPGPKSVPVFGNIWRFLPKIGEYDGFTPSQLFESLHREFGDVVRMEGLFGRGTWVMLFNPEYVEMIYKLEGTMPVRDVFPSMSYFRQNNRQDIFKEAKGLLTSQGQEWYQFRNKVNSIMMQPKMVKQYVNPVDKVARELVMKIKRIRGPDHKIPVCIIGEINKWSLESIARLALDTRLGCLADDLAPDSNPQKMINIAEIIFTLGRKLDFEPSLWRYVSTPTYRKTMAAYNDQLNLSQQYISEAIERIRKSKESGEVTTGEPGVLEKLLEIDYNVAVVMATDMMLAGVDTTSTALASTLYHLATNHSKQDLLRGEIISLLPQETSKLTAEHLGQMPYLKACMKEAARLFPVTPGSMRNLTKDTVIDGYQIPKGVEVIFPHMYLSKLENQFPRPFEFLPERWLREHGDADISYKRAHPFCYSHFGYGARSCIGQRFAELEMEVVIVNFLRNFNLTWDGPAPTRTFAGINYLKGPYHFVFKNNDIKIHGDMACIKSPD